MYKSDPAGMSGNQSDQKNKLFELLKKKPVDHEAIEAIKAIIDTLDSWDIVTAVNEDFKTPISLAFEIDNQDLIKAFMNAMDSHQIFLILSEQSSNPETSVLKIAIDKNNWAGVHELLKKLNRQQIHEILKIEIAEKKTIRHYLESGNLSAPQRALMYFIADLGELKELEDLLYESCDLGAEVSPLDDDSVNLGDFFGESEDSGVASDDLTTESHECMSSSSVSSVAGHENEDLQLMCLDEEVVWDDFKKFLISLDIKLPPRLSKMTIMKEHANKASPLYKWLWLLKNKSDETNHFIWGDYRKTIRNNLSVDHENHSHDLILLALDMPYNTEMLKSNDEQETFKSPDEEQAPPNAFPENEQVKLGFTYFSSDKEADIIPATPYKRPKGQNGSSLINNPPLVTFEHEGVKYVECCIALVSPSREPGDKFKDVYQNNDGEVILKADGEMCLFIGHPYRIVKWTEKYYEEHQWRWSAIHRVKKIGRYLMRLERTVLDCKLDGAIQYLDDIYQKLTFFDEVQQKYIGKNLYEACLVYIKLNAEFLGDPVPRFLRDDSRDEMDEKLILEAVRNADAFERALFELFGESVAKIESMIEKDEKAVPQNDPIQSEPSVASHDSAVALKYPAKDAIAFRDYDWRSAGKACDLASACNLSVDMKSINTSRYHPIQSSFDYLTKPEMQAFAGNAEKRAYFKDVHGYRWNSLDDIDTSNYHKFIRSMVCVFSVALVDIQFILNQCRAEAEGGSQISSRDTKYHPGAYALGTQARMYLQSRIVPNSLVTYARFPSLLSREENDSSGQLRTLNELSNLLYGHHIDDILASVWVEGLSISFGGRYKPEHRKANLIEDDWDIGSHKSNLETLITKFVCSHSPENVLNKFNQLARSYYASFPQNGVGGFSMATLDRVRGSLIFGANIDEIINTAPSAESRCFARVLKAIDCSIWQFELQHRNLTWLEYWSNHAKIRTDMDAAVEYEAVIIDNSAYKDIAYSQPYEFKEGRSKLCTTLAEYHNQNYGNVSSPGDQSSLQLFQSPLQGSPLDLRGMSQSSFSGSVTRHSWDQESPGSDIPKSIAPNSGPSIHRTNSPGGRSSQTGSPGLRPRVLFASPTSSPNRNQTRTQAPQSPQSTTNNLQLAVIPLSSEPNQASLRFELLSNAIAQSSSGVNRQHLNVQVGSHRPLLLTYPKAADSDQASPEGSPSSRSKSPTF